MTSGQKTEGGADGLRELSEKDLDEITKAFGEQVRAQTIEQRKRMKTSLRREIDAARAASSLSHATFVLAVRSRREAGYAQAGPKKDKP